MSDEGRQFWPISDEEAYQQRVPEPEPECECEAILWQEGEDSLYPCEVHGFAFEEAVE